MSNQLHRITQELINPTKKGKAMYKLIAFEKNRASKALVASLTPPPQKKKKKKKPKTDMEIFALLTILYLQS